MPTLTAIMPNFNHAHHLPEAIERVLGQTRLPEEFLIIDDGSTDNSVEIISTYAAQFPFIRFERNDTNRGVLPSLERAVHLARGDYVAFLSADDYTHPTFFERSMALIDRYPQCGLCFSSPGYIEGGEGAAVRNDIKGFAKEPSYLSPDQIAEALNGDYICGHTSIIRRDALLEVGGMRPELHWHCDWFAVHAIAFRYGACFVPDVLSVLRVKGNSYSTGRNVEIEKQLGIVKTIYRLVCGEQFRDVMPKFKVARAMVHFTPENLSLLRGQPEFWTDEYLDLIRS